MRLVFYELQGKSYETTRHALAAMEQHGSTETALFVCTTLPTRSSRLLDMSLALLDSQVALRE